MISPLVSTQLVVIIVLPVVSPTKTYELNEYEKVGENDGDEVGIGVGEEEYNVDFEGSIVGGEVENESLVGYFVGL